MGGITPQLWALVLGLFLAISAVGAGRDYINSISDLEDHYRTHIRRVGILALSTYDENRATFPDITRQDVIDFMKLHDQAKINDTPEFRRTFWIDPEPLTRPSMLERLYSIYGLGYRPASEADRARIDAIKMSLNGADRNVAVAFFKERGMLQPDGQPDARARALLRLERIADVVDRGSDPVAREEFNFPQGAGPPLDVYLQHPDDLALAVPLKERYNRLAEGFAYTSPSQSCRRINVLAGAGAVQ